MIPYAPGCTGKTCYTTPAEAMAITWRTRQRKTPVHPYQCKECRKWHLTSYDKKPNKRRNGK